MGGDEGERGEGASVGDFCGAGEEAGEEGVGDVEAASEDDDCDDGVARRRSVGVGR